MDIKENVLEVIGNTPMVHLARIEKHYDLKARIYAKLERCNPSGSIKDRIAKEMLEQAMAQGKIHADTWIIEPTSGNTGIGLAMACAPLGLHLVLFMPSSASKERVLMMKAFGAEVRLTPASEGMAGAVKAAESFAKEVPSAFIPDQFANPANALAHYKTTGPEIERQMDGKIDIFVASFGTGGTLTGTGKYLKERIPSLRLVGLEPLSSPFLTQGRKGPHKIQGIGAGFKPDVLDVDQIDAILAVSDEDAYRCTRELCTLEGLFCGISSGCNVYGAIQEGRKAENAGKTIVTVLPDDGERYLSVENLYDGR